MKRARLACSFLALVLLGGCDDAFAPPMRPAAVRLVGDAERAGTVGDTLAPPPAVEVTDRDGKPVSGVRVEWSVGPGAGVLSVPAGTTDSRGVAGTGWTLPLRSGRYSLTAAVEGFAPLVLHLTARAGPVSRVAPADPVRRMGAQDTIRLGARAFDRYDNPVPEAPLAWTSSDTLVARVDGTGLVRSLRPGRTTVTAAYGSVAGSTEVVVTSGLTRLALRLPDGAILPGTSVRPLIFAYANLTELPDPPVELASSDTTVVAVDAATGTLRGRRAGKATITASSEGVVDRGVLTVAASVGTLTVAPSPLLLYRGWAEPLKATFLAADGTPLWKELLAWSSTAPSVVTVDSTGYVAGAAHGDAEVRVTAGGRTAAVTVRVRRLQYASVSVGADHACGTTTEGDALCWGGNLYGQVGMGTAGNLPLGPDFNVSRPTRVVGGRFEPVAAGWMFTCGVDDAGAESCWGKEYGPSRCDPSSRGVFGTRCTGVPVRVSAGPFASLAAGLFGVCGTRADGTVASCRGGVAAGADPALRGISIGFAHACALDSSGRAYCWGTDAAGETGGDSGAAASTPRRVGEGLEFRSVAAGSRFTCGVTTADEAYCWGTHRNGQLGSGAADSLAHPAPARVAGGLAFASLAVGDDHACGITRAGEAYCWGSHADAALGTGSASAPESCGPRAAPCSTRPLRVTGGLRWRTLSAGAGATCGIATDDALYCWGRGVSYYQSSPTPVPTRMARQL